MVVYRKIFFKHKEIINTIDSKILDSYILYKGELSYIGIFLLHLRMALIFTDFPAAM